MPPRKKRGVVPTTPSPAKQQERDEDDISSSAAAEPVVSDDVPVAVAASPAPEEAASEEVAVDEGSAKGAAAAQPQSPPADNEPRTRLMIKEICLENFKSYAGKQVIGPFHKKFSAIVGPNGSGKSNVIDALLFVFGSASKKIRSKKLADLIHRSDKFPNVEECRVTVTFQDIVDTGEGDDDYEVVPGSVLEVARVAVRKNGTSRYYMKGKGSSFGDVKKFLYSKGVDLDHNRFLILQGEVEQIALMKPKGLTEHEEGLLEYLEEIIGSNKYVKDIETHYEIVESANDERNRSLNSVKLVERELAGLQGARDEAKLFLERSVAVFKEKNVLHQLNAADAAQAADDARHRAQEAADQCETIREEAAAAESASAEHQRSFEEDDQRCAGLDKQLAGAKKDLARLEGLQVKANETRKHAANRRKALSKALDKETAERARVRSALERHETDASEAQAELDELTGRLAAEEKALEDIYKKETAELQSDLAEAQARLAPLSLRENDAQSAHDVAAQELRLVEGRAGAARKRVDEARQSLRELREKRDRRATDIAEAQAELKAAETRLPTVRDEQRAGDQEERQLAQAAQVALGRLAELKSTASEAKSASKMMQALLKAKSSGLIKGIHGRLGDLAWIEKRYDVAASTACPQLHHVVVETSEAAQKCVKILRKYSLGVATFIVLDKLPQDMVQRSQAKFDAPAGATRLFDLIQGVSEPRHKWAFYHAMRDTLVAPDLNAANKLAFGSNGKRFRVVTVQGQLIDASGTMSGGGSRTFSGAMATSAGAAVAASKSAAPAVSADELAALKQTAAAAQDELNACRKRLAELEDEAHELAATIKRLQRAIPKMEMDLQALPTQIAELEEQLPVLEKELDAGGERASKDAKHVQALRDTLATCAATLAEVHAETGPLEKEVAKLERQILDAGGTKMRVQKSKVEELSRQIDLVTETVTKAEVGHKTAAKALKKAEAKVAKLEKELSRLQGEGGDDADGEGGEQKLDGEVHEARSLVTRLSQERDILAESLTEKRAEQTRLEEACQSLQKRLLDASSDAKALAGEVRMADKQAAHWAKELDDLRKRYAKTVEDIRDIFDQEEPAPAAAKEDEKKPSGDKDDDSAAKDDKDDKDGKHEEDAAAAADKVDDDDVTAHAVTGAESVVGTAELPVLSAEELASCGTSRDIRRRIAQLESDQASMNPNMGAIQQWQTKERVFRQRTADLARSTRQRDEARAALDDLRKRRLDEFMAGFSSISMSLKEMYRMITSGSGDAELELIDSLDPFAEGVGLSVRPPGKSWKNVANLSGGEKTLSSLALVFAMHAYRPCPLLVLDEIDAALDFRNVGIIALYLQEKSKNAQCTCISLRSQNFEKAQRLLGIYKHQDCSRSVSIDPREFAQAMVASSAAAAAAASTGKTSTPKQSKENSQN